VANALGGRGKIIALDILPMSTIAGVDVIQADFRDLDALERLDAALAGARVDLVLSDLAPNMTGVASVDQARALELAELARDFADLHLRSGGAFLAKLFQGVGFDGFLKDLRARYAKIAMRKPKASRARSPEVYALCTGFRGKTPLS
jgi:23S rRNA (uridine2552-2'-O)-methyltransferase